MIRGKVWTIIFGVAILTLFGASLANQDIWPYFGGALAAYMLLAAAYMMGRIDEAEGA